MAIDTREKRSSSQALLVPSYPPGVEPSAMDQAARQAAVWVYAGILAEPVGGAAGNLAMRRLGRAGIRRPQMHDGREGVFIFKQPSVDGVLLWKLLGGIADGSGLQETFPVGGQQLGLEEDKGNAREQGTSTFLGRVDAAAGAHTPCRC